MEKKGWREELKILLEREEEEILLAERVAKPYSGKRREDIYNFVEKELEKAREEGKREGIEIYSRYIELREKEKHTYFEDKDVDELNELELLISNLDNK